MHIKLLYKILWEEFKTYLGNNKLLFREDSGTENAVNNVVNFICRGLDKGYNGVSGVFYDLLKAFDLVEHDIMLEKLKFHSVR